MGCDIHLYVERRIDGIWRSADKWTPNKYYEEGNGEDPEIVDYNDSFYAGRNYDLFAILADVRNGRGFAGIKTGEGFNPIADPKGLPVNVCDAVGRLAARWGEDGHSHSFHSVADLMAYDWTQTTGRQGWVSAVEYEQWTRWDKKNGAGPDGYSGGISGGGVQHIDESEMERRISQLAEALGDARTARADAAKQLAGCFCLVKWTVPYYRAAGNFLSKTMPKLWRLGTPDDVRIVFWFDN